MFIIILFWLAVIGRRDLFFRARCTSFHTQASLPSSSVSLHSCTSSFHTHAPLLTFFVCFFTLVHEFFPYSRPSSYLLRLFIYTCARVLSILTPLFLSSSSVSLHSCTILSILTPLFLLSSSVSLHLCTSFFHTHAPLLTFFVCFFTLVHEFFPYSRLSSYLLRLFRYTRAWVPHF